MAKINFPKKQEQRLIPKYLLEYAEELQENHPDPSAEWGGGSGGEYTAGTGIIIDDNEISVDTETIPTIAELSTVAFSGSYSNLSDKPDLSVYELKEDAFTGDYGDLTNKPDLSVYELKTDAFSGDYNDLTNKPDLSIYAETADLGDCAYLDEDELSIAYSQITGTPSIPTNTSDLNNDSGYITSSALSGYATETWVNNQGYLTSVTWSDVSNKPTFATVATTGDYDDLTDKPDLSIYAETANLGTAAFIDEDALSIDYSQLTNTPTIPIVPTNVSAFNNDAGYITGIDSSDVISALGYTPGTSNFSGSYNDFTNKPTIPTATSQLTNDSGFITSASLYGYVTYESVSGSTLIEAGNYYGAGGNITGLTNYNMLTGTRNTFELPGNKSGTIALTSDIPSVSGYALLNNTAVLGQQWSGTNDFGGLITNSTASGNYTTHINGFAIPDATTLNRPQLTVRDLSSASPTDYNITIPAKTGTMALTSDIITSYNDLTNKPDLTIYAESADLATVATTGDYDDLLNKPTIPDAVSGTNDGTNWTSLTIGSDTYNIGSGSTPSNMVTINTAQTITGAKTFEGVDVLNLQGSTSSAKPGFAINESDGTKRGFLELRPASGDQSMVLGVTNGVTGHLDFRPGLREFNNNSNYSYSTLLPLGSDKYTTFGTGNMNMVLGVNGVTAGADGNITQATETLTFTYSDNTTATFTFVKI